ncbi:hypothetical protein ACVBEH_23710, partial [Roseateles sp. GG27B]
MTRQTKAPAVAAEDIKPARSKARTSAQSKAKSAASAAIPTAAPTAPVEPARPAAAQTPPAMALDPSLA